MNPIDQAWMILKEEGYVDEHGYNEHGFDEHGDMDLDSGYSVRVSGDDSWDSFFDSKESMLEWLSDILDKPGTFEYTISPPPEPPEPKVWIDEGDEQ
jgi:hypothetical protein